MIARKAVGAVKRDPTLVDELLHELLELSRIGRLMNTPQSVSLTEAAHDGVQALADALETAIAETGALCDPPGRSESGAERNVVDQVPCERGMPLCVNVK